MTGKSFSRREALKTGAAVSAFAGVTILASRKTLAQRAQKLIYWHLPTFAPVADDAVREYFEEFRKMAGLERERGRLRADLELRPDPAAVGGARDQHPARRGPALRSPTSSSTARRAT